MSRGERETILPDEPEGVDLTEELKKPKKIGLEKTVLDMERILKESLGRTVLDVKRIKVETRSGEKTEEKETPEMILKRADTLDAAMFEVRLEEAMRAREGEEIDDETRVARIRKVLKDLNDSQEIRMAEPDKDNPLENLKDKLGLTEEQVREGKVITNRSFILHLIERGRALDTVYKPARGEPEMLVRGGIEPGTGFKKSWLARKLSEAFELGIVPPLVLRQESEGIGSVQKWIEGAKTAEEAPDREMKPEVLVKFAMLDFFSGNQDRYHGRNHAVDEDGEGYGYDHDLCFSAPLYNEDGEERVPALLTASRLLQEVSKIDPIVHTKVVMEHLKIFWESPARQRVLKESFRFALGEDAEAIWRAFMLRVQETLEEEMLPKDHEVLPSPEALAKNPEAVGADVAKMRNSLGEEARGEIYRKSLMPKAERAAA